MSKVTTYHCTKCENRITKGENEFCLDSTGSPLCRYCWSSMRTDKEIEYKNKITRNLIIGLIVGFTIGILYMRYTIDTEYIHISRVAAVKSEAQINEEAKENAELNGDIPEPWYR